MFFAISKLLINFIFPLTWIGFALLCALLIKSARFRKWSLITALSLLVIFTNPLLLNIFASIWDIETKPVGQRYSCAIILGGFVGEDQYAKGYFNGASDRFIQALRLKNTGKTEMLLFTGGNADLRPSGFREANWLSEELRYYNIPDSSVLFENAARNTLENASLSKRLVEARNLRPPYLLVTSAFHMRRSLLTFENAGLSVVPYSCNYIAGREKISFNSFIPDARILSTWNFYIKEVVGYFAYYIRN